MPHVPHFPSKDEDDSNDEGPGQRRGIIDRIIGDGNWPTPTPTG